MRYVSSRSVCCVRLRTQELNIPIVTPSRRSNFHLNDPAALRAMALKAGFSQAVTYFTSTYAS